jgi:dolichol-phosphate mannosyltransferase
MTSPHPLRVAGTADDEGVRASEQPWVATAVAPAVGGPELTVIIPTYNERENVRPLIDALDAALEGIHWEALFVDDDSADGTAAAVRELGATDARVRCLQRLGRRGLSTAVVEGMLASSSPYLAVIDGDLQHDPAILPDMLKELRRGQMDIVVGSRYVAGGSIDGWQRSRAAISNIATRMARLVVSAELSDPMSGYFMLTRGAFESAMRRLSGHGFKILLDLFASTPMPYRFREIPFVFRRRVHGESKLDNFVVWEYVYLLLDKSVGKHVPVRFLLFTAVGALGLVVHLATLRLGLTALSFGVAQAIATMVAMTSNFLLNNLFTYRDRRLRGWRVITGLLSFWLVCGFGAAANVGIASAVFNRQYAWWVSGLTGAAISAVWNYAISSKVTWSRPS